MNFKSDRGPGPRAQSYDNARREARDVNASSRPITELETFGLDNRFSKKNGEMVLGDHFSCTNLDIFNYIWVLKVLRTYVVSHYHI